MAAGMSGPAAVLWAVPRPPQSAPPEPKAATILFRALLADGRQKVVALEVDPFYVRRLQNRFRGTPQVVPYLSDVALADFENLKRERFTREFEQSGFRGPINWYRNFDRSWERTAQLAGAVVTQPALFIAGTRSGRNPLDEGGR